MLLSKLRAFHAVLLIGGWLLVVGCMGAIADETLIPGAKTVPDVFQSVVQQLQGQTQIPIVLPTQIPTDALVSFEGSQGGLRPYINVPITADGKFETVSAYVLDSAKEAYTITLDATLDCHGVDACSFGLLTAQQIYQNTPSVASQYAFELAPTFQPIARSPEPQGEVQLSHGINGYFVSYVCGANCDTSKVFWEQGSYRYSVGIRMASQAAMVKMANSAIENES